jgi:hypothetical protein
VGSGAESHQQLSESPSLTTLPVATMSGSDDKSPSLLAGSHACVLPSSAELPVPLVKKSNASSLSGAVSIIAISAHVPHHDASYRLFRGSSVVRTELFVVASARSS